jgi:hypothetical protein
MQKLKLTILFLAFIFLPTIAHGATEFISVIDPDNGSGTDYTSLSSWEAANQVDLTAVATQVFSGTKTGTISDNTLMYLCRGGVYQTHTGTATHTTATQILLKTISGTAVEQSGDIWYTNNTCNSANYFTLSGAQAGGDSAIAVASCRTTAGVADTTAVTVDGWTTSATNYIKIWTDPSLGNRHSGVWDAGKYRLDIASSGMAYGIMISDHYVTIDGIQLKVTGNFGGVFSNSPYGGVGQFISNTIIWGAATWTASRNGIYWINTDGDISLANNVVYGFNYAGSYGIRVSQYPKDITPYVYNNTVYNCATGIAMDSDGYYSNNISYNNTTADFSGTGKTGSNYNFSKDATAPGANSIHGTADDKTPDFISTTAGSEDFHLQVTSDAIGVGTDLSGTFTTDIDNQTRVAPWDIGADEAATPIYRSVGPGVTAVLANGATNHLNIVGSTATFDTALPDNIGVGDALEYDDDNDGDIDASDSIAFITGRTSSTVYTIKTASGAAPTIPSAADEIHWNINRAYTSLSLAETGTENTVIDADLRNFDTWSGGKDITASNEQWNIVCYAGQGGVADTTAVTINDWTTSEDSFIKVYTPTRSDEVGVSQRHSGVWDDGKYKLIIDDSTAIISLDDYAKIEGLQVRMVNTNVTTKEAIDVNFVTALTNETKISDNIIDGQGSSYSIGIYSGDADTNIKIWNNFIYDCNADFFGAVRVSDSNTSYIYNNTIVDSSSGIIGDSDGNTVAKNNIVKGCGDSWSYYYDFATGTDYNATDGTDNIGTGSNNRISQTFSFSDETNNDFHLASYDTAAKDSGLDLSSDPYLSFSTDIDGDMRGVSGSNWDIGADEYSAMTKAKMQGALKFQGSVKIR